MQRPSFITHNRAFLAGVLLGATAFIAACSPNLIDDPGYHLVSQSGHLDADPTTFMTGVGCTVQSGADSSGSVAIKLLNGAGMSHFRCPGIAFDSVQHAIESYRAAARDSVGGAAEEANGGEDDETEVLVHYECDVNTDTIYWSDGTYDTVVWEDNCRYYYLDGGAPNGPSGPDDPPPPTSLPDSACKAATNDSRKILNSSTIQASLEQLLADSKAQDTELGGYITLDNGQYNFHQLAGGPATNNCNYDFPGLDAANVVAMVHTHPDTAGTTVICRATSQNTAFLFVWVDGPSSTDWTSTQAEKVPSYIVDPRYIWRVDENSQTYSADAAAYPSWNRGFGDCATPRSN